MAGRPIRHGSKWRIRWVDESGIRRSEVFANKKDAELALNRRHVEAEERARGLRRLAPIDHTFKDLCELWVTTRGANKRSLRTDESMIRSHLMPAFGEKRILEIGTAEAEMFKAKRRGKLTENTVNHHLSLLISMLRHAKEIGWLDEVPLIRKHRIRTITEDFSYLRTKDEIRRFLAAAQDEGPFIFALYSTAIYTGLRLGELAGLLRDRVDLERRLITVHKSYTGPTKNGETRHVPIVDVLLPTLRSWCMQSGRGLVFTNSAGNMLNRNSIVFQETLHDVLEAAGFDRRYITFHDLRHTFASHWMMNSGDLFKLQKVLGHKSPKMTLRYAHLCPDAFADDLGRFGSPIQPETGSVVSLPR